MYGQGKDIIRPTSSCCQSSIELKEEPGQAKKNLRQKLNAAIFRDPATAEKFKNTLRNRFQALKQIDGEKEREIRFGRSERSYNRNLQ